LAKKIEQVDIKEIDSTSTISAYRGMSFSARDTARAADIYDRMINDLDCTIILTLAGSTGAAGCLNIPTDLVKHRMVDVIVSTGASIIDMDLLEALGFNHYKREDDTPDMELRDLRIDRIYDTYIDEEELQAVDSTMAEIASGLEARPYTSREFLWEVGKWLSEGHAVKKNSLLQTCYECGVPIFCPALNDSSAGLGLIGHQFRNPGKHIMIDSIRDFMELTLIKVYAKKTGIFMIGGGVPKNYVQDTVIGAECLGLEVPVHEYVIQVTVADERDGALSGSTLEEAASWGKVSVIFSQMVFAEATLVLVHIASYLYHKRDWEKRKYKNWGRENFLQLEEEVRRFVDTE